MSPSLLRTPAPAWRFALAGAVTSLPITVLVNWLPNSEADVAGGVMIFGALLAGVFARLRSGEPDAAGLRAGVLGGVVAIFTPVVANGPAVDTLLAWPSPFEVVGLSAVVLVLAALFGLAFGRIGGWLAAAVTMRWTATAT